MWVAHKLNIQVSIHSPEKKHSLKWERENICLSLSLRLYILQRRAYLWLAETHELSRLGQIIIRSKKYNLDFKRKIWTWTGIRTSDLQITSLGLLPIELSKSPFQFMFEGSSWNDKSQTLSLFTCKHLKSQTLWSVTLICHLLTKAQKL